MSSRDLLERIKNLVDKNAKLYPIRLLIYRNGDIPWNYAKFLYHTAKLRFIQRVGR